MDKSALFHATVAKSALFTQHRTEKRNTLYWSEVESTKHRIWFRISNIFPPSCTQRQCEISKDIADNDGTMFEFGIPAGATGQFSYSENLRISSWSYDMQGHVKKCVERFDELTNKTTQQIYFVSTSCIDDHHFKEEELKSVGDLSELCSQVALKYLYLTRIGRSDILWSVNKLARLITKCIKVCDKRVSRLISYIHHTYDYK